jgi:formylglycine-generating enzyme required for sulfatase activity
MAEPSDPKRPKAPPPAGQGDFLPRIQYTEPPKPAVPEETAAPEPKAKKTRKDDTKSVGEEKGKRKKSAKGEEKKSKLEETPTLDTYDTRRKVRIAVGAGAGLVLVIAVFMVWNTFAPRSEDASDLPDEGTLTTRLPDEAPKAPGAARHENEAGQMLKQARVMAESGNLDGALSLLKKVATTYPKTAAAKEAQASLDRPKQGLPLFVNGPAVAAKAEQPAPPPVAPPAAVVEAEKAAPAAPTPANGAAAELVLPNAPPEPSKGNAGSLPKAAVVARPLPDGFHPRAEAGVHPSGWPLQIVGDRDGATMVLVPGGSFTMGRDDAAFSAEAPAHQVNLPTYYIDQHEVTVGQFNRFMRERGYQAQPKAKAARNAPGTESDPSLPVVHVTDREAQDYAHWAGKALPTEAQWEAAARTPDGRLYPWGSDPPSWERARAVRQIDPVMSYPTDQSPYGVFDMSGNAWEWTADWYDPTYFQQFKSAPADNPIGPIRSKSRPPQRTIKGGSKSWQVTWREGMKVDARLPYLGFRCVLTVEQAAPNQAQQGPNPAAHPPTAAQPGTTPRPNAGGVIPF